MTRIELVTKYIGEYKYVLDLIRDPDFATLSSPYFNRYEHEAESKAIEQKLAGLQKQYDDYWKMMRL